ncbi:hypothetical protein [Hymenobacter psychrophilus]|uniref:PEP-CTERM protein-sorting domain-containing protein n=1 Tax=Hymenobacter psychrophilus TaxID=651662 RepID=A0A1H3EST7_9BACT|nr:hypothetical protein [Hymenobacter psychrophilus]SDX81148.1 PEP-CTERM protein-sorting domain-containing protein [Hymenobacter psychrophilus]
MMLFAVPTLLLLLPAALQAVLSFRRRRSGSYLGVLFMLTILLQLLAGIVATGISAAGFGQRGLGCATGAGVFFAGGVVLAVTVVPGLALLAALIRWQQSSSSPQPL